MEQLILSTNSNHFATAPSATPTLPNLFRAVAVVIACGTVFTAIPSGPMSDSGMRPYHGPLGTFAPAEEAVAKRMAQLQSLVDDQGAVVVSDHLIAQAQRLL